MIDNLSLACEVCERGAALEQFRHIVFDAGTMRAFNGIASFEAPSGLEKTESFAVNEHKLSTAVSACSFAESTKVRVLSDFLVLKADKLTIRVRKLDASAVFHARIVRPPVEARQAAGSLQTALRAVAPFVSSDASRPWSTSVLLKDKFAWATNNLSIARSPLDVPFTATIPAAVVPLLCMLPKIDWFAEQDKLLMVGCSGQYVLSFPSSQGDWPDVKKFFAKFPKTLPDLDEDLLSAAKTVEKFADRFVTLNDTGIEGKSATIESEYEIAVKKGKGTYSARLLSLILTYATKADFSPYPEPIYFTGENIEGVATGVAPDQVKAVT